MIGLLRGTVVEIEGNLVLIEVAGVGYEVIATRTISNNLQFGAESAVEVVCLCNVGLVGHCELFNRLMLRPEDETRCVPST